MEEEEEDTEVDDLIEIAEEAALIQAERYVDDEADHQGRQGNKQRQDENVQMVADLMLAMNLDNTVVLQQDQDGWEVTNHVARYYPAPIYEGCYSLRYRRYR